MLITNLLFSNCPNSFENKFFFISFVANSSEDYNSKWASDLYIKNY